MTIFNHKKPEEIKKTFSKTNVERIVGIWDDERMFFDRGDEYDCGGFESLREMYSRRVRTR